MTIKLHSHDTDVSPRTEYDSNDANEARATDLASRADSLAYLIDMLQEMKAMATASGFGRLGTIIQLAEDEARQQLRQA